MLVCRRSSRTRLYAVSRKLGAGDFAAADRDGFLYYIGSGQQRVVNDSHQGTYIHMLQDRLMVMRCLVSGHMRTGGIVLEVTNESARHAQHAS
jgi:hypothetical protein